MFETPKGIGNNFRMALHAKLFQHKLINMRCYPLSALVWMCRIHPTDVSLLKAVESALSGDGVRFTVPVDVAESLLLNLRDRSHAVRRITLHMLDQCTDTGSTHSDGDSVYKICLLAELVEPSVHDYREKLRYLRMLDYSQVARLGTDVAAIPLLYLFGCLKIGFSLLWKEVKQLITTYRPVLVKESIWSRVESELRLTSAEAESAGVASPNGDPVATGKLEALADAQYEDLARSDSNPLNAHKFRIQLWQTFGEIVGVDTSRNRIFSELFQQFMRYVSPIPTYFFSRKIPIFAQIFSDFSRSKAEFGSVLWNIDSDPFFVSKRKV